MTQKTSADRMRVTAVLRTSPDALIAFMYRPKVVAQWIGEGARLTPIAGRSAALPGPGGTAGFGTVTGVVSDPSRHQVAVTEAASAKPETTTFRVTAGADGRARLRIEVRDLADADAARIRLQTWQEALNRLQRLVGDQSPRRPHAKQALIVVHGIGEQLPGQTLRAFVDGVFGDAAMIGRVKPDTISTSFEMRKITVEADISAGRPTTDVYELYWANLIRDTTFGQVAAWMLRLLLTPLRRVPSSLRGDVWIVRVLVLVGLLISAGVTIVLSNAITIIPALVVTILGLVWLVVLAIAKVVKQDVLINFVGDAARYLQPKPDNIAIRQQIREAGVDLLEALHTSGEYDRIVVFGHSLGSVIAYDILSFAWIRFGRHHRSPDKTSAAALSALERACSDPAATAAPTPATPASATTPPASTTTPSPPAPAPAPTESPVATAQNLQHEAWKEYRGNSLPWLVTDFISAGCPLAHADLLLPLDKATDVEALKAERVFPTCPPVTEQERGEKGTTHQVFSYTLPYRDVVTGQSKSLRVLNHAAPFAVTRWTNLYFPFSGGLRGDPVGGPLSEVFGRWIDDRALDLPGAGPLGFAHTLYWDATTPSTTHIEVLRDALRLNASAELLALRSAIPLREE